MTTLFRAGALLVLALGRAPGGIAAAPPIRVGIASDVRDVALHADAPLATEPAVRGAAGALERRLRVVVRDQAPPPPPRTSWKIRVRREKTEREARRVRTALKNALDVRLEVVPEGAGWLVLAGPVESREAAEALLGRLSAAGMSNANIVSEAVPTEGRPGSRLVFLTAAARLLDAPAETVLVRASSGPVAVDGRPYRGAVEVSVNARGLLDVVNVVDMEDYLRGVVPREMGPEVYPEPEGLRAQAIAARSWAATQRGRHAAQGYDVCPTAHCQVYGGQAAEHPLSDDAVASTAGVVVVHDGAVATTYFSSTCGGRTEAVENVFDGPAVPYLRGVSCDPERVAFHRITGPRAAPDARRVDGRRGDDVVLRLAALGVLAPEEAARTGFGRRATSRETAEWLRRAASRAGYALTPAATDGPASDTRMALIRWLGEALGWSARRAMVSPADMESGAHFVEMAGLTGDDLGAALAALGAGVLPDGLGVAWGREHATRSFVLECLDRWLQATAAGTPRVARFVRAASGGLEVTAAGKRRLVEISPKAFLLSGRPGAPPVPVAVLDLKIGDKLVLLEDAAGAAAYVAREEDPDGAAYDRTSAQSWWRQRTTFEAMARSAVDAGVPDLADIEVTSVSKAGRVVGLRLTGQGGQVREVRGFAVRGILGLPDLRAELAFERDASGRLRAVDATGRGWGHGVGLCQVGAYGMALDGKTHAEILGHYFPGTSLAGLSSLAAVPATSGARETPGADGPGTLATDRTGSGR